MLQSKFFRLLSFLSLVLLGVTNHACAQFWNPNHSIGTVSGKYGYQYGQTPDQLVEIYPATIGASLQTYEWQICYTANEDNFVAISGANQSSYTPGQLVRTTYYRRKTTVPNGFFVYSNVIKLSVVSVNWEDRNYIREYDVKVKNVTTAQGVDQLTIGDKMQTTSYLDGLGRSVENISRETATPSQTGGQWGDVVQFSKYDAFGRKPVTYLPYTTTTELGKFKTTSSTEQPQYYSTVYNETSAFSTITYDNSPLNRVMNVKDAGTAWAASLGNSATYDVNLDVDNVQMFSVDYVQGNPPVYKGVYPAGTLFKMTVIDENGKQVVTYSDKTGRLILKKIQLDDAPATAYTGWLCTYSIFDDLGLLRYQLQPEAVKYLEANNWSFAGTNGQLVLNELCYQYNYDDKGRLIWKKTPGANALSMLYDARDRLVFSQDGNQAALATPQWTVGLYDELDRLVISTLYNTSKSISSLQTDINNPVTISPASSGANQVTGIDLYINQRQTNITRYAATNSIQFASDANGSFSSGVNDEFAAEIDPNAGQINNVATTSFTSPISSTDLNNSNVTSILKYIFYDDYSFGSVRSFNTGFTNLSAYSTSDPNVIQIATSQRTVSMVTGEMTRVLNSTTFLSTTLYYDEDGLPIQTLEDNIKGGTDITTRQYHFDGRVLSLCNSHTTTGTGYSNFITLNKYNFDKLGRVTSIQKQLGSNAFKSIASYDYDDAAHVKTKHLDPDYNAAGRVGLENLNYSFNIHNQITGVNKDFALKNPSNYNKWDHFFGMYLGFDNRDNIFSRGVLNGQVTGVVWNTQGDDAQRKYEYSYDNANRLINAVFSEQQHPGDGWTNNKMDFSVSGNSGKITYDLNGNLLNMLQKGVQPGNASPIVIDNLNYVYSSYSNKLQSVTDQMTATNVNGQFGDFKDGNNGSAADYVYDNNGNVVIDLNKNAKDLGNVAGANGIHYNYLDKPDEIRIPGKGTIKIVYSADGEKLQRIYTPDNGTATTTTYINQFVYQATGTGSDALAFINMEEGRIRVITPVTQNNGYDALAIDGNLDLPNGKKGVYDYFIKDYQENVRMVLTEETHSAYNTCTMETGRATAEDPVFGQTGSGNEVEITRYATPAGWQSVNTSASVSRLGNTAGHNIGPNTLQKVMAGDQVSATVQYYYQSAASGSNPNFVTTLLTSLGLAIAGSPVADNMVKGNAAGITSGLNSTSGFVNAVQPTGSGGTTPQAYLTILFFDERFKFIEAVDGGVAQQQVATSGSGASPLALGSIKAPKNGYVYVYVSNRSDQDVYFDNLQVGVTRGNIIEENHYYAYGLKISAISSRVSGDTYEGTTKNNFQYQGAFAELDEDIGWQDFPLRNYDAQTGRFVQPDPFEQFQSPYSGMGNDPTNIIDPSGGIGIPCPGTSQLAIFFMKAGEAIGKGVDAVSQISSWISVGINISNRGVEVYNRTVQFKIFDRQLSGNITLPVGVADRGTNSLNLGGSGDFQDDDDEIQWMPFYKKDLITYTKAKGIDPTENNLGEQFENIIEEYMKSEFPFATAVFNFRRAEKKWTEGTGRNSKPDFVSDDFYDNKKHWWNPQKIVKVLEASGYEVKQNGGKGIYLSSNDGQIRGHIDNLAAKHASHIRTGKFNPSLTLLTTYDVKWSPTTSRYASDKEVTYIQRRAKYRIVRGKYQFKFVGFGTSSW